MERIITSVGIDVSKGKSTVCILRPYGEIISAPFEVRHTEDGLRGLTERLQRLDGEIRVTMEAQVSIICRYFHICMIRAYLLR